MRASLSSRLIVFRFEFICFHGVHRPRRVVCKCAHTSHRVSHLADFLNLLSPWCLIGGNFEIQTASFGKRFIETDFGALIVLEFGSDFW